MTQLPTKRGYEAPTNTQFSVFLENRVGKLLEMLEILEAGQVRVVAMSVLDTADCAIIRLITSRAEAARRLLERHEMPFAEKQVLVVELTKDHSLISMCKALLQAEVSIRYTYPVLRQTAGTPAVAVHTEDETLASQILQNRQFTLLGEGDLDYSPDDTAFGYGGFDDIDPPQE